jgi:hypothetical protein
LISLGAELATARLPPLTPEAMNVDLLPLFRRRCKLDEATECVRASEVLDSSQPVEQPVGVAFCWTCGVCLKLVQSQRA